MKIFKISLLAFCLLVIESLLSIIFHYVYESYNSNHIDISYFKVNQIVSNYLFFSFMRILLYQWILVIILNYFSNKLIKVNKLFKLVILNMLSYIAISLFMSFFILISTDYLEADFFYVLIASTMISPFIVNRIKYFKDIINSI